MSWPVLDLSAIYVAGVCWRNANISNSVAGESFSLGCYSDRGERVPACTSVSGQMMGRCNEAEEAERDGCFEFSITTSPMLISLCGLSKAVTGFIVLL